MPRTRRQRLDDEDPCEDPVAFANRLDVKMVLSDLTRPFATHASRSRPFQSPKSTAPTRNAVTGTGLAAGARISATNIAHFGDGRLADPGAVVTVGVETGCLVARHLLATLTFSDVSTPCGKSLGLVLTYAFDPTSPLVQTATVLWIEVPRTPMAIPQAHRVEHCSGSLLLPGARLEVLAGRDVVIAHSAADESVEDEHEVDDEYAFRWTDWHGSGTVVLV